MSESQKIAISIARASDTARRILGPRAGLAAGNGNRAIGLFRPDGSFVPVIAGQTWEEATDALLRDQVGALRAFKQAVAGDCQ